MSPHPIAVTATVAAPLPQVWQAWNQPEHIVGWAFASDDWEATAAQNDLRVGGRFTTHMAAKDKSQGFDFTGVYTQVKKHRLLEFILDDGRQVQVELLQTPQGVQVTETFEPETENSRDLQQTGWQAILDNFKSYAEAISQQKGQP